MDGVLMVSPTKDAFDQLAAIGHAEDLRQRPGRRIGRQPFDGAPRLRMIMPWARLTAEHLLPGEG